MIHVIKINKINRTDYIKHLDYDSKINGLFAVSKLGTIQFFMLIKKSSKCIISEVMETIDSYKNSPNKDILTQFVYMPRVQSYVEGTRLGYIKIRDPSKAGECLLHMRTNFTDEVQMIHYNRDKNVLFASCKDGQFRVWKVPHEWRNKAINDKEQDSKYTSRMMHK